MITPSELHAKLAHIVADESGCQTSWAQHPGPLASGQLERIGIRLWVEISAQVDAARQEEARDGQARFSAPPPGGD